MFMRVAFYTLGCKLNQAETESLAGRFGQAGFQLVSPDDVADIYIANTCTVTHIADRKSRHWLRLARRRNPHALIIATGCYAQRALPELAQLADLVLDNGEKEHLLEIVKEFNGYPQNLRRGAHKGLPQIGRVQAPPLQEYFAPGGIDRTRSLIKIQDGCHSPCAYCIVPKVRPHEYSLPASQIIDEVKQKVTMGYKEVVLTGTKVGCYKDAVLSRSLERSEGTGEESGASLGDLVQRILCNTDIERLRLSSLQPQEISAEFLAMWQDPVLRGSEGSRLCRHFHLALQSGSDTMLPRMRRCYTLREYQGATNLIRQAIPGVAITTDVMVGFPGESDDEFEQSYLFCQQAGFANIHVFPFSARPGTAAAKMPNQVKDKVKQERTQRMLQLSQHCRRSFCARFLGQTMRVLWEKETKSGSGIYSGLTDNYIRVLTQSPEPLADCLKSACRGGGACPLPTQSQKPLTNQITPVKLVSFHNQGMWAELVNENLC